MVTDSKCRNVYYGNARALPWRFHFPSDESWLYLRYFSEVRLPFCVYFQWLFSVLWMDKFFPLLIHFISGLTVRFFYILTVYFWHSEYVMCLNGTWLEFEGPVQTCRDNDNLNWLVFWLRRRKVCQSVCRSVWRRIFSCSRVHELWKCADWNIASLWETVWIIEMTAFCHIICHQMQFFSMKTCCFIISTAVISNLLTRDLPEFQN